MCVEIIKNRACLSKMIDLRGHMPRFTLKNEHYAIYLLRNAKNDVLKPSEQGLFFQDDWFEEVTCLGLL